MEVLHSEGLVNHAGPESCVAVRKGIIEALTGDMWAELLSCDKTKFQDADVLPGSEGNNEWGAKDKPWAYPAQSLDLGTHINHLHGNREIPTLAGSRC